METAQALQATAQAVLQNTEPITQVGSCPLRQVPEGGWGCPSELIWGLGGSTGRSKGQRISGEPPSARAGDPDEKEGVAV